MKAVLISIQPKWVEKIANGGKTIEVRKTKPNLQTPFKVYIYCTNTPKYHHLYDLRPYNSGKIKLGCVQHNRYSLVSDNYINGKVIGEFVCDRIDEYGAEFTDLQYPDVCDKNVCLNSIKRVEYDEDEDEPVYRYETSNEEDNPDNCKFLKESCLTFNEVRKYIGETFFDKHFYGWHISNLKIYDKPKELSEFTTICRNAYCQDDYGTPTWFCKDGYGSCAVKDKEKEYPYNDECIYFDCPTYGECCEYEDYAYCLCNGRKPITRPPQSWCYVEVE